MSLIGVKEVSSIKCILKMSLIILILGATGCVGTYPVITDEMNSSYLKFQRNDNAPFHGSTIIVFNVDDNYVCKNHSHIIDGTRMATIDVGNPFVGNENIDGLRVASDEEFRMLVSYYGDVVCDMLLSFKVESRKEYLMVIHGGEGREGEKSCGIEVFDIDNTQGAPKRDIVDFIEYQSCY